MLLLTVVMIIRTGNQGPGFEKATGGIRVYNVKETRQIQLR